MNLAYLERLASIAAASFFVVNAGTGAVALLLARLFRRRLESCTPRRAATLTLALRLAPGALALAAVVAFCVPSFLALEPAGTSESASLVCLAMAAMGMAAAAGGAVRGVSSWWRSWHRFRRLRGSPESVRVGSRGIPVEIVQCRRPFVALVGMRRPRLVVTRAVLAALTPSELAAALRHERAHAASRDNWKRLITAMAPDPIPLVVRLRGLETSWSRYSERAADDRAVAGSARRSVALAAALVRVARLGAVTPAPLATSLLGDARDLEARVERLLRGGSPAEATAAPAGWSWVWALGSLVSLAAISAMYPVLLTAVHELLERFMN